ncbi:MAG: hypothetical protein HBSAPP04_21720 [Ignavibacteriaceae bacterium]|nr:MAG: hypothetical protein HBSAPP04_21720 [Ignavibacteriaceae bacterium]
MNHTFTTIDEIEINRITYDSDVSVEHLSPFQPQVVLKLAPEDAPDNRIIILAENPVTLAFNPNQQSCDGGTPLEPE